MTFSGNLEILEEFIGKFKSYLEEITKENENIDALMSGFSAAIRVAGGDYNANTEDWRIKFVNAKDNLAESLRDTVNELTKLLTSARAAKASLESIDTSVQSVDKTI